MPTKTRLDSSDYATLYDALANAESADSGETERVGFHFELIATLNALGYRTNSADEAKRLARNLLDG